MAKTKSSVRGVQNKKIVTVKSYKRSDGTNVRAHRRSTPNQENPLAKAWGFSIYKLKFPGTAGSGDEYCIIFFVLHFDAFRVAQDSKITEIFIICQNDSK